MSGQGKILGPFNRVEGDLEIRVEISNQQIVKAQVNTPLFRGFEKILCGKHPQDALVFTPRICGICSVAQSVAAAQAIATAQQIEVAPNGLILNNLILACENLADHLSHFYLFFMPDFARQDYRQQPWFENISRRFKAQTGSAIGQVLPARAEFLHLTGLIAGKWPHSLAIQPGGNTRPLTRSETLQLLNIIYHFRHFLEQVLFGVPLETITQIQNKEQLLAYFEQNPDADFSRFGRLDDTLALSQTGCLRPQFLSYGAYLTDQQPAAYLFQRGVWDQQPQPLDEQQISEDISHSWLDDRLPCAHPFQGNTQPRQPDDQGYSWCKAPRLNGRIMEVGALARQMVDGQPLIMDLVHSSGSNVFNRVIARLLELARVVPAMEQWVSQIQPDAPFCHHQPLPDHAQGQGMIEAARGALGHWLIIRDKKIANYQIIAPTTWNFSPRDGQDQPGPLEQALQQTMLNNSTDDLQNHVTIQHIIRSFDPCMVCTVH